MTRRLSLLCKRSFRALGHGVLFTGTRRCKLPARLPVRGRWVNLTAPPKRALAFDYVNLWLDDEYGLGHLRFAPATIVDVGANIGLFSLWAARCFPDASVQAYEPNPYIAAICGNNVGQVGIRLYSEAVGRKAGFAALESENCGDSRVVRAIPSRAPGIPMVSLNDVVARRRLDRSSENGLRRRGVGDFQRRGAFPVDSMSADGVSL